MIRVLILIALVLPGFSGHRLVKTKINNEITVSIPVEFYPMTPDDIAQRYPSVRQPLGAFTDEERLIDFSANISATQWPDTNLEMAAEFFKSGVYNLYDRVDMISEGIHEVNKKRFIFFEFDSRVNGDQRSLGDQDAVTKYTYIQYLVEPGRTLVFSFNCPSNRKDDWQETAHAIMESIRIK